MRLTKKQIDILVEEIVDGIITIVRITKSTKHREKLEQYMKEKITLIAHIKKLEGR